MTTSISATATEIQGHERSLNPFWDLEFRIRSLINRDIRLFSCEVNVELFFRYLIVVVTACRTVFNSCQHILLPQGRSEPRLDHQAATNFTGIARGRALFALPAPHRTVMGIR